MTPSELVSREIIRLAHATQRSAYISTTRLSAFYNLPEKSVRQELANLAGANRIRLAGWQSNEEFVASGQDVTGVRVYLLE